MNKIYTFVFLGIVGSGKGTQVKLLSEYLKNKNLSDDILSTSTGEEFRKIISGSSYTGELVRKIIEKGELQPNFLTTSLFANILISGMKEGTSFIVDGYPRTISQSESFISAMKFYNRGEIYVINIEISKEEAIKRMKQRGRLDDNDEGIAKRIEVYENDVIPAMDYFKGKDGYIMHTINGEQSIEDVFKDLIKSLNL
jgi:adenylate kinase